MQTKRLNQTNKLGEKSIIKLMAEFSLPSIVAMMVVATYHLINMAFIGRSVGPVGIAAIAVSAPITFIQGSLNQLIANGCAANVSIELGKGDVQGAQKLVGNAMIASNIIAISIMVFGHIFLNPILIAFGATENILPLARDYMEIMLFSSIFGSFTSMNPIMRSEGYPLRAMLTMLISTGVNLCLAPTFIFGFGLGIRGAACATLIAQFTSALWIFTFLINKNRVIGLRWKYYRINLPNTWKAVQLGLPSFLMRFTQSMLMVVMNNSLRLYGGDIAISSWGITNNIINLITQPIFGLTQGVQPIIGYNIGAKNYKRVKEALAWSLSIATFFSFLCWSATRLIPNQLFSFFTKDPELIEVGTHMITVFMSLFVVVGSQQAGAAYFQYIGMAKNSIILTLSRPFILIFLLLVLPRFMQMEGILLSGPTADMTSALITGLCIVMEVRRLNRLEQQKQQKLFNAKELALSHNKAT